MLIKAKNVFVLGALLGSAGVTAACDNPFAECLKGFDCPGDGLGPHSGGASPGGDNSGGSTDPSGGAKAGGAGNAGGSGGELVGGSHSGGAGESGGMAGEGSGGAAPKPCNGKCKGDTPFCDETTDECVGCLKHTDCKDPTMPMCSLAKECVPCLDDPSCTDTLQLEATPVCLNGSEDTMTGEKRPDTGACAECGRSSDCNKDICDPETLTCLDGLKYRKSGVCVPCEHDLECLDGHYCVPQTFGGVDVGSFCMQTKEDRVGATGNCDDVAGDGPPFVDTKNLVSVGGHEASFCVLARTSCQGYRDHLQPKANCVDETVTSDASCGAEAVDDGLCRKKDSSTNHYCTYKCAGPEDCKIGGTQYGCVDNVEPRYCGLSGL